MSALFFRSPEGYLLRFPGVADFELTDNGRHVLAWPGKSASDSAIEHALLNQVLPLALSLQGEVALHASAVAIRLGSVAFIGESGRGKSTLAASFARQGMSLLTDDGVHLTAESGCWHVQPGPRLLRLREDSRNAILAGGPRGGERVSKGAKLRISGGQSLRYGRSPVVLLHAYFLGDGAAEEVEITRLSARDAFVELMRNSFVLDVEDRQALSGHFERLSRLALLPVFSRLDYPRRFEALAEVREAILKHSESAAA